MIKLKDILTEAYRPMLGKPQKDDWIRMPNGRIGKIVEVEARFHNDTLAWVKGPKPKKGQPAVFGYDLDDLKMSKKKGKIERKGKTIIWDFK